jgi:hypothetical protein
MIKLALKNIPWVIAFFAGGWAGPFPDAMGCRWAVIYTVALMISTFWEVNVDELFRRYPEFPARRAPRC